jgi:hypothetical protein
MLVRNRLYLTARTRISFRVAMRRRLRHYGAPDLLMIDEVGYLSYSNWHADLRSS